jgi:hypothetical protein
MPTAIKPALKIADEIWIATALLHKENSDAEDFSIEDILQRVRKEAICGSPRPGVYPHIVHHAVANRPASPNRRRVLFETSEGRRRLFLEGDPYHPEREGSKTIPVADDLPPRYRGLLTWFEGWSEDRVQKAIKNDPLLSLRGSGRHIWADEHADEYVNRLRDDWE